MIDKQKFYKYQISNNIRFFIYNLIQIILNKLSISLNFMLRINIILTNKYLII